MLEQDRIIGKTIYGWTDEREPGNTWYDSFFRVWRPRPNSKKELYPSWSSSNLFALDLIEHLISLGYEINMFKSDAGFELQLFIGFGDLMTFVGFGNSIPQALASTIEEVHNRYETLIANMETIKQTVERSL